MRATIIVQGVVQGVGFRFFVIEKAREYKVKGYVRNRPDGTVEVVAEGVKSLLQDFINRLKIGPVSAHVTGLEVAWDSSENQFSTFDIRY
jgi:acylphosphatase